MRHMYISLIAVGGFLHRRQRCIFQAKQVNYFPGLFSFFFYFILLPHPLRFRKRPLWDGCDEMERTEGNLSSVCTITFI